MKKQIIQAFSLACAGTLLFSFCSQVKKNNNTSLTAGIVSASAVKVDESAELAVSGSDAVAVAAAQPQETYGYTNLGVANVDDGNVNIRDAASEEGSLVGKLPNNAGCEILGEENGWTHIKSGEVEGYVSSSYILTGQDALDRAAAEAQYVAKVKADTLRVRVEPNTTSEVLSTVPMGTDLEVVSEDGEWVKVNIDGEEGYVSAEFVECTKGLRDAMTLTEARFGEGVSDVRVDLVTYATQFVGNPYVWGGTSLTHGADCSGFVLSIFGKYGFGLPHSSRAQANYGRRVSTAELQPGDLLFYGSGRSISHVAIYIGGGQIVHASTERTGIIISSAFSRSPICCVSLLD